MTPLRLTIISFVRAAQGDITGFREAIGAEMGQRALNEIDARRVVVAQTVFESGASPREKRFVGLHWDKMDEPFNVSHITGKPNGVEKAGKRPADSDEDGYVDPFEDENYGKDPWGKG